MELEEELGYTKGITTSDIQSHIEEIYGYQVSDSSITRITDKILPLVKKWQTQIQQCIIHQIRSSTQFVSYKNIKYYKIVFR